MKNITSSNMKFNMQMNIAKAIGISLIVSQHYNWDFLSGGLIPALSYHVALFFFISGYFVNKKYFSDFKNLLKIIQKIVMKWLTRFYAYNIFYGFVTYLLFIVTGCIYGTLPTIKNIFISSLNFVPFHLDIALWFIVQLIFSLIIFYIILYAFDTIPQKHIIIAIIFLTFAIFAVVYSNDTGALKPDYLRFLVKTGYSLFIIYTGYIYKNYIEEKIKKTLKIFLIFSLINCILLLIFKNVGVNFINGSFHHNLSALISPFVGIFMILFISQTLVPYVEEGSFIDKMGKNSFHIMANHILVVYIIQTLIYSIDVQHLSFLPNNIGVIGKKVYRINEYCYFYTILSLVICTYFAEYQKRIYNKIKILCKISL